MGHQLGPLLCLPHPPAWIFCLFFLELSLSSSSSLRSFLLVFFFTFKHLSQALSKEGRRINKDGVTIRSLLAMSAQTSSYLPVSRAQTKLCFINLCSSAGEFPFDLCCCSSFLLRPQRVDASGFKTSWARPISTLWSKLHMEIGKFLEKRPLTNAFLLQMALAGWSKNKQEAGQCALVKTKELSVFVLSDL